MSANDSTTANLIVGCYLTDLYCGHAEAAQWHCTSWPGQFTGETEAGSLREARRRGWLVRKSRNGGEDKVRCPRHREDGK